MPNSVVVGTAAQWFHNNVLAHRNCSWGEYHVPVEQCNYVLAQLTLLHMHVKCIVNPEDGMDDAEEEVSWAQIWFWLW